MKKTPSAEEVRPARCRGCGVASRPLGQRLNLHGHGQRSRQVWGPLRPNSKPIQVVIVLRRYRCRCGKATLTVGPLGLVTRRLFSAAALGLALYLWGQLKLPAPQVQPQVSPWKPAADELLDGWRQPGRWVRAIYQGRLFVGLLPGVLPPTLRAGADRAASALAARCAPVLWEQPMRRQVFAGAALAS